MWDRWLLHLWGRRCYWYLTTLTNGLTACRRTNLAAPDAEELAELIPSLERLCTALRANFIRGNMRSTPSSSLREREDIANFHLTYIDPILFSALHILQDSHISLDEDTNSTLWRTIKDEIVKHTKNGTGKSDHIADESTTWWGLKRLIYEEKDAFCLGPNDKVRGYQKAVTVCVNLIRSKDGHVSFPSVEDVWSEATPEIYGETRTRLLIVKNCAEIIVLCRKHCREETLEELEAYLVEHYLYARGPGDADVHGHIALLGIALETSCALLQLVGHAERKAAHVFAPQRSRPIRLKTRSTIQASQSQLLLEIPRQSLFIVLNGRKMSLCPSHYCLVRALAENLQANHTDVTFKEFSEKLIGLMSDPFMKPRLDSNAKRTLAKLTEEHKCSETNRVSQLISDFKKFLSRNGTLGPAPLIAALPKRAPCALRLESAQVKFSDS